MKNFFRKTSKKKNLQISHENEFRITVHGHQETLQNIFMCVTTILCTYNFLLGNTDFHDFFFKSKASA